MKYADKLVIRLNDRAGTYRCAVCGKDIEAEERPECFMELTYAMVCHVCLDRIDPNLGFCLQAGHEALRRVMYSGKRTDPCILSEAEVGEALEHGKEPACKW